LKLLQKLKNTQLTNTYILPQNCTLFCWLDNSNLTFYCFFAHKVSKYLWMTLTVAWNRNSLAQMHKITSVT